MMPSKIYKQNVNIILTWYIFWWCMYLVVLCYIEC